MTSSGTKSARVGYSRIGILLFAFAMSLLAAPAWADDCVADRGGIIDGFVNPVAPSQINIDGNCTIRNFPASNPLTSNISFVGNNPTSWLVIFDNVVHTGQMSCDKVQGNVIWFTNGSSSGIHASCQNLLIPVEKIDKANPAGRTTATIGVPFTYKLTIPILYDPATGIVINTSGSPNELHSIAVTDDLNATGADLRYVSHVAYWRDDGTPVPHTFSNVGGVLTFDNFPIVPAGRQFVIELTVVLNDTATNTPGKQFINTAKWQFGRLIDGVYYQPLPGEWGVTPPMTIAAPQLVVTKSGPATMNLGQWGSFALDVQNTGLSDAWNVTLRDLFPDGAMGGMCDRTPEILSAQVFAADGVTPVPGKGPLNPGSDYQLSYSAAPACQLDIRLLTAAGTIGANERLIVKYRTQLDVGTQNGVTLTNIAGAIQWFNGDSGSPERVSYSRTLTDGTVGILDFQDAHTVTVALAGTFFEKTVMNLRSGDNPATVATPGDTLRYTLSVQTTNAALNNFSIYDELDALNTPGAFVPGTLTLVSPLPAGAVNNSSATGGPKGTGVINIGNLNLPANSLLTIQFDIRIATTVPAGVIVSNQGQLLVAGVLTRLSDDPNVNGKADPLVSGNEDPTRVLIAVPLVTFQKTVASGATAHPGDVVRYRLQVKNTSNIPVTGASLIDDVDQLNSKGMFVPGTLALASALPAGATNNSNPNGGTKGTGLLDIRNLSIGAAGGANDTLTLEFTVRLVPVIANGTVVLNQSQISMGSVPLQKSDDPTVGGTEDPTRLVIESTPVFRVLKTSQDMTGDPAVLRQGDTLHYTITVKNVGTDDATDAMMRDPIPANTTYVAGSTRLNGTVVADSGGVSPLVNGMLIDTPQEPTPGIMRADASDTQANVATITFDVVATASVVDGTAICNQAFVSSPAHNVADSRSDDPRTSILNDPTCSVVGNLPLLYAEKKAALQADLGTPGVVDPGDVVRYTITIYNNGNVPATAVVLNDAVPANTTYVANSVTVNGLAVGQPDGGVSPLIAGVNISSSDLTPPLPTAGQGTLSPGKSALIQFDVRVNDGVPGGTLISNQGFVHTQQLPVLPTDGDGDPSNGPQPTVVVVGNEQQLSITKEVTVVGGGPALPGAQLEYVVRVTNISTVPVLNTVITDDLNGVTPGYLTFVDQTATLNGSTAGITIAGSVLTADYYGTYGPLPPGQSAVLRFRATLSPGLAMGTRVTNTAVVKWNNPAQTASASVSIDVGGITGVGILSGTAWHDANFNKTPDTNERRLEGWSVELYRNGHLVYSALTDATGAYRISGVAPNDGTADKYELRFTRPGAGPNSAKLGKADSIFTNDLQRISDIVVQPGSNLQNLNLPIAPNGVIYNAMSRTPIAGAAVKMLDARSRAELPASCFDDAAQQGQVTLADGYYKFDVNFSDPACTSGGNYLIEVTAPPGGNYVAGYSQIIPPKSDASTAAFSVPACPGSTDDAIPATAQFCEAQPSELAPAASVPPRSAGTTYYLNLRLDGSQPPGSSEIFNNHIPLDPQLLGSIAISKTTPLLNVNRGQLVPYVITVNNVAGQALTVSIVDHLPAGFAYVEGSALVDGVPTAPSVTGRDLNWNGLVMAGTQVRTVKLLLAVGAGVTEGEYVNRAQATNGVTGSAMSGEATATVRVVADPTFDCTDVIGKVFNDANRNGRQDGGEMGLPGVRVVTARGLQATTDRYGRYHITCAITPNESRGSNFVLKIDDRTLPSGFRLSTDQVQIKRATSGKALKMDFGASIHRVVGIDLSDAVFEPGTTEIRAQWRPRVNMLLEELRKGPAVLRLSYIADTEDAALVGRRVEAVKRQLTEAWNAANNSYVLTIEPEVFWRRGAPLKAPRHAQTARGPESR